MIDYEKLKETVETAEIDLLIHGTAMIQVNEDGIKNIPYDEWIEVEDD